MTIKVDDSTSPESIDFTTVEGPEDAKGRTLKAIDKLDGDDLSICLSVTDERPKVFEMEPEKTFLFELKRKK